MSCFIKKALVVVDVEDGHTHVEIEYVRYIDDKGYKKFVDYFLTSPIGDWTKLSFKKSTLPYEDFLRVMVKQTLEVKRRLAEIALENIFCYSPVDFHTMIRILHTTKILEPSFEPPVINKESKWQVDLLNDLCRDYIPDLIERCDHSKRLIRMFNVLKGIQGTLE